jgi:hypothetical protein
MVRTYSATNALDHQADIAKVQEWLGHAMECHFICTAGKTRRSTSYLASIL